MGECLTFFFYSFKSHLLLVQVILNHLFVLCCHSFSQECLLGTLNSKNSCKWDVGTRILKDTKIQNSLYLMTKPAFRINQKKKKKTYWAGKYKCKMSYILEIHNSEVSFNFIHPHVSVFRDFFFFFLINLLVNDCLEWFDDFFWLHLLFSPRESLVTTHFFEKKNLLGLIYPPPQLVYWIRTLQCLLNIFIFPVFS